MATKFFGGTIYLGNHSYTDCLYVDDAGLVASKETWGESPNKAEVNLDGAFIAPAFRDAHAHPLFAGRESLGADISGLDSIEEIGAKLLEYSKSKKQLAWLDAASYDRNLAGQLTRRALDAFVSEIPVVLHAEDHHTLWVNSKALEIAGLLDGELPVLTEGGIDLDEQGLPTGILREWQAMQLVLSKAPKQTITEDVEALLNAEKMLLAAGIIEVQDAWIERGMAEVYLAAEEQLQVDYKLAFRVDAATFDNDFEYASEMIPRFEGKKYLKIQAIKFFVDGVFGSATAAVINPYQTTKGHGDLNWTAEEFIAALTKTHERNLQAHIHAIGDRAVQFALDAIAKSPRGLYSPVIAHAELTSPELISQAKHLGVVLCMQPFWAQYNGMLSSCTDHLGHERVDSLYSIRSMLDAGVDVAFSSDWPVSSYKPLDGITVAVNRRFNDTQTPHNESEAVTLEQALDCYSSAVCRMLSKKQTGLLTIGQPFDAVLLSPELLKQNLEGFKATEVLAVYRYGTRLFPHN